MGSCWPILRISLRRSWALEACSGAQFLGARLREQGHDVRLIPAQFIKPYRKSNKNDFIDAEAIAEAVGKENTRFVPIKSLRQLQTSCSPAADHTINNYELVAAIRPRRLCRQRSSSQPTP